MAGRKADRRRERRGRDESPAGGPPQSGRAPRSAGTAGRPRSASGSRGRRPPSGSTRATARAARPITTDRVRRGTVRAAATVGLSTTRRAAVFAIVVCALALSVAVPLRTYLSQRAEVEVTEQQQAELRAQVDALERRKAELEDPAQVEAEARERLRYVMPGETPYMVELPGDRAGQQSGPPDEVPALRGAWYQLLWSAVAGG